MATSNNVSADNIQKIKIYDLVWEFDKEGVRAGIPEELVGVYKLATTDKQHVINTARSKLLAALNIMTAFLENHKATAQMELNKVNKNIADLRQWANNESLVYMPFAENQVIYERKLEKLEDGLKKCGDAIKYWSDDRQDLGKELQGSGIKLQMDDAPFFNICLEERELEISNGIILSLAEEIQKIPIIDTADFFER